MTSYDYYARLLVADKQLAVCDKIIITPKAFQDVIEKAFNAGIEAERHSKSIFDTNFGKGPN